MVNGADSDILCSESFAAVSVASSAPSPSPLSPCPASLSPLSPSLFFPCLAAPSPLSPFLLSPCLAALSLPSPSLPFPWLLSLSPVSPFLPFPSPLSLSPASPSRLFPCLYCLVSLWRACSRFLPPSLDFPFHRRVSEEHCSVGVHELGQLHCGEIRFHLPDEIVVRQWSGSSCPEPAVPPRLSSMYSSESCEHALRSSPKLDPPILWRFHLNEGPSPS